MLEQCWSLSYLYTTQLASLPLYTFILSLVSVYVTMIITTKYIPIQPAVPAVPALSGIEASPSSAGKLRTVLEALGNLQVF